MQRGICVKLATTINIRSGDLLYHEHISFPQQSNTTRLEKFYHYASNTTKIKYILGQNHFTEYGHLVSKFE